MRRRLFDARSFPTGESDHPGRGPRTPIFDTFSKLSAGKSVDLEGAATRLDFDVETGDSSTDFAVLCMNVDEHGAAADNVESGLFYRARTQKLEGALACP